MIYFASFAVVIASEHIITTGAYLKNLVTAIIFSLIGSNTYSQATKPGAYFVKESVLDERLEPSIRGTSTNKIYLRQKVEVFEVRGGWARVSKFYDGTVEGQPGRVARWVDAKGLSEKRPAELTQPAVPQDVRIDKNAIPRVGEGGLSEKDVQILYKGALKFLNSGKCSKVELGDKSISKPNTYYINCGGPNLFFTPADL